MDQHHPLTQITVDRHRSGHRLDVLLAEVLGVSRGRCVRLLEAGRVTVNGRVMSRRDKGTAMVRGDRVGVVGPVDESLERAQARGAADRGETTGRAVDAGDDQEQAGVRVLRSGDGWVVVDKPPGLAVHPLRNAGEPSVLGRLLAKYPQMQGVGEGGLRSGVVHRLDVATSGCLMFATDDHTWQAMRKRWADRAITKRYAVIVRGTPAQMGTIDMDLAITQHRPARVAVVSDDQASSDVRRCILTIDQVCELPSQVSGSPMSLVHVTLHTGFLHQIRVMLSALGAPVVGDDRYSEHGDAAERLMLHAFQLAWDDVSVQSPLPDAMQRLVGPATSS